MHKRETGPPAPSSPVRAASSIPVRAASVLTALVAATSVLIAPPIASIEGRSVAPGVEHTTLQRAADGGGQAVGPFAIKALRLDLAQVRLDVVHAMDEAVGLETTSSIAERLGAIAAINGGYFRTTGTYRGDSTGTLQIDRTILSEPDRSRSAVGFVTSTSSTRLVFGQVDWTAEVTVAGQKRALDGINRARGADEVVLFTPGFHRTTLTDDQKWDRKRRQGLLVPGVDCRIVDADGRDLPFDGVTEGDLLLRGPWIIERYHKLDDDADRVLDGYWRSGDVGTIDEHGYLKITDRLKDVVKSGGEWISSIDMENALVAHPRIREAAVVGIEHPKWQERPVVLAATDDGAEIPIEEIHALLSGAFAKWQMPDTVLYVDTLPRTSVGKLDKKAMRAAHADLYTNPT